MKSARYFYLLFSYTDIRNVRSNLDLSAIKKIQRLRYFSLDTLQSSVNRFQRIVSLYLLCSAPSSIFPYISVEVMINRIILSLAQFSVQLLHVIVESFVNGRNYSFLLIMQLEMSCRPFGFYMLLLQYSYW